MKRYDEVGKGEWGIFSMSIPGRTGKQCSNLYLKLIKQGKIVDKDYHVDENGNIRKLTLNERMVNGDDTSESVRTWINEWFNNDEEY